MLTASQIYAKKASAFRRFSSRTIYLAGLIAPNTGGNQTIANNWQSFDPAASDAHAFWNRSWARWHRLSAAFDARYSAAEHMHHGPAYGFLWCEHCKAERGQFKANAA